VGKPSVEDWLVWGAENKLNGIVLATVHQYPHVMQSYTEDVKGENPYIFNPKRNTGAFASPRSLAKAASICDHREAFGADLTMEALEGTVGVSFARDMMAYLEVADKVPTWVEIVKDPKKTLIPKSAAAQLLLVFGSVGLVDKTNVAAFVEYFFRYETEVRMLWARQFMHRLEQSGVMQVAQFREVLTKDCWIFS
jgi:hypothetical protein